MSCNGSFPMMWFLLLFFSCISAIAKPVAKDKSPWWQFLDNKKSGPAKSQDRGIDKADYYSRSVHAECGQSNLPQPTYWSYIVGGQDAPIGYFPWQVYRIPVGILYKSIAGRYLPVRVADGPITARYKFIKNASWDVTTQNIGMFSIDAKAKCRNEEKFSLVYVVVLCLPSERYIVFVSVVCLSVRIRQIALQ